MSNLDLNQSAGMPYERRTGNLSSYYSEDDIRYILLALNAGKGPFAGIGWRDIEKMSRFSQPHQISFGTLNRFANGGNIEDAEIRAQMGLLPLVTSVPCPTCLQVHPCDCGTQRIIAKPGASNRKRSPVARIYPGTEDKIIQQRLKRVTGNDWIRLSDCE